jgi:RNA polymerase sigma factor (sigma-70 family)
MIHPDQKYIEALLHNDKDLLDELYQKFSGKIKWMVLQNNGTEADAADILQEGLMAVYHKARTQDFVLTCPFESFLYLVCKNKWLNELSKRKNHRVTSAEETGFNMGEDTFKLAEDSTLQEQRLHLLLEKLAAMGETCQQLLRLSWSDKSMEEVAEILHMTYGYVRKKKSECMAKLVLLIKQSAQFSSLKW